MNENTQYLEFEPETKHLRKVEFKNNDILESHSPSLMNLDSWENISSFSIITGRNGSGKSHLLKYLGILYFFTLVVIDL